MDINAVIANFGNGNVTTGNITTGDIRKETIVTNEHREEFMRIIEELKREIETLNDNSSKDAVDLIQEETKKDSWNKKLIKFALDTVQKTGVTLAAKGIVALGAKAITLLGTPDKPCGGSVDANPKTCCQTIHDCQKVVPLHYESEWQYKYV